MFQQHKGINHKIQYNQKIFLPVLELRRLNLMNKNQVFLFIQIKFLVLDIQKMI